VPTENRFNVRSLSSASVLILFLGISLLWMALLASFAPITYDESVLAHLTWLLAQGLKPYTDFHAVHPPFVGYLFAPMMRLMPERFESIILLRIINLGFSAAVLVVMTRLLLSQFRDHAERWLGVAALVAMATQPQVLRALSEFRADHLATALTLLALLLATTPEGKRPLLGWLLCGCLFTVAMGVNPKMILVPIVTATLVGVGVARRGTGALRAYLLGAAGGITLGLAVLLSLCVIQGVDIHRLYEQVFVYHGIFKESFTRKYGLAKTLFGKPGQQLGRTFLAWIIGVIALVQAGRRSRWHEDRVLLILGLYALLQPLWVPFPYRQYTYTIFLAWVFPLAAGLVRIRQWNHKAAIALSAFLVITGVYFEAVGGYRVVSRDQARQQISLENAILDLSPPGWPVAAQRPYHPIFRRDSTFFWVSSDNPGGPGTEDIMSRFPAYGRHFSYEGYLQELRANPPGLIIPTAQIGGKEYRRALAEFLDEHYPHDYAEHRLGGMVVFVRKGLRSGSGVGDARVVHGGRIRRHPHS
jgi:hypothetical protein